MLVEECLTGLNLYVEVVVLEIREGQQVLVAGMLHREAKAGVAIDGGSIDHTDLIMERGVGGLHLITLLVLYLCLVAIAGVALLGIFLLNELLTVFIGIALGEVHIEIEVME